MDAIEKRAREIYAAQFTGDAGHETRECIMAGAWGDDEAIAAIIAALTPPEGFVLVDEGVARDAARYRHLKGGYLQCWEDSHTEEPSHANFCFECKGWDIDAAIDADIGKSGKVVSS